MGACFSTTDWHLKDGQQEVFVDRWTTFLKWTRETQEGFERARLVGDEANPHHFLSVGEWRDSTARQAWADEPRFLELFMPCLEVCDEVQSRQYDVKVPSDLRAMCLSQIAGSEAPDNWSTPGNG